MQQFDLTGRVALVTGASSGLGAGFARVLAEAGAHVALVARRADRLEALADELRGEGLSALPVVMDVTDVTSIQVALDKVEADLGAVQILVNNAGISRSGFLRRMSEEDWDAVLDTNLKSVWQVAAQVVNRMIAASAQGTVINISSVLGFGASKVLGPYMAAKAGVVQLTRSMAMEWAENNIRVNAIAPGYFPTEINEGFFETSKGLAMIERIPMKRIGDPTELAGPLLLLASDASSFMTGSTLVVDGGHLCQQL
ncbi:MAG: SDR family NAD(P)-dependent oxidoreductase [Gammaproteobacteria bacterium]